MTAQVESHMKKIEEKHRVVQGLWQQFLETTSLSPLATPKVEPGVVIPPTHAPSRISYDGEHLRRRKCPKERRSKKGPSTCSI